MLSESQVQSRVEFLSQNQFNPSLSAYLSESWQMVKSYPAQFIVLTFVYFVLAFIPSIFAILAAANPSSIFPKLQLIFTFVVYFVLFLTILAFFNSAHIIKSGKTPSFKTMFDFKGKFFTILLGLIVSAIITVIGFLFLIIPGVYLSISFMFVIPLYLFTEVRGLRALQISRKIAARSWFNLFVFFLVISIISSLGLLACGVGILATFPMSFICYYLCFSDMMDLHGGDLIESIGLEIDYRDAKKDNVE